MLKNKVWAIVPAAGIGSRMAADKPKQYLLLDNKPVIQHTLERLASHPAIAGIVIALASHDPWWESLGLELSCPLLIADGGEQRADSVLNALQLMSQQPESLSPKWVLVHDAARPCLRHQDIDRLLEELMDHSVGGILGLPVADTVKRANSDNVIEKTVERTGLWRASTPQMFKLQALTQALLDAKSQGVSVTDEASAMELSGYQPMMVEGHADNIKITVPQDLVLAELYLQQQAEVN